MFLRSLFTSRPAQDKWQRTYRRQRSPQYWVRRARLERGKLWVGRNLFQIRGWTRARRESISILSEILTIVSKQLLFAVALVVGLEILERAIIPRIGTLIQSSGDLSDAAVLQML